MSRSGYMDDYDDQWRLICYRGAVKSAIRGKRGQAFLREMRDALDALPEPKLCEHDLQRSDGMCCAIGAVGKARGINMVGMDPDSMTEDGKLSKMFDIADSMIREIEWENDEGGSYWYAENKRDEKTGFPIWEKDENGMHQPVYKTNSASNPINKMGFTKEKFESRQDEIRWLRMRSWIDEQIHA